MRKIKSTALLSAFVAVASLGAISHEAHGTQVSATSVNIPKEMLPGSVTLTNPITITPNETIPATTTPTATSTTVTLTLSGGAEFISGSQYFIGDQSCTSNPNPSQSSSSIVLSCTNALSSGTPYQISTSGASNNLVIYVPQSASSIVLTYSSTLTGDISGSATIAQVQQQLYFAPISAGTAYIDPSSLSTFLSGNYSSSSKASNSVVLSNSAYNNNTWSNTINANDTMNFVFTGIPGSVSTAANSGVTAKDSGGNTNWSSSSIVNGSTTVSFTLADGNAPFKSASSDTITFTFSNSSNASISSGTISLSSIVGQVGSYSSVTYLSTPTNFLTFTLGATQLYIPDALVSDSNAINYSYLTISMPQGATISSISALNTGVTCSVSSISLTHTGTTGVYYMDLSQLVQACPGISSTAWQSGVPLVITISGSNVGPNTVTADAYAVFGGMLKRIPVNVVSGNGLGYFSY